MIWLAKDVSLRPRYVTLKISNNDADQEHERDMEDYIAKQNPSHMGHAMIRTCLESFEIPHPEDQEAKHLCLVYKPMREPFWLYQRRFVDEKIPLPLIKAYLTQILGGLDYLHSICGVAHNDIKLDNILVSFENESIIQEFVDAHLTETMEYKIDSAGRHIFSRHNDFGFLSSFNEITNILPTITDFGTAMRLNSGERGAFPTHPDHYRPPEATLGCGWDHSGDIWMVGVLTWEFIEHTDLFEQYKPNGRYCARHHLAEMSALRGPPPQELIERSDKMIEKELMHNALQMFNGPFFKDGKFLYEGLIPPRKLEDTVPSLDNEEKAKFLNFVKGMLAWLPEDKKSAREFMKHPFLNFRK